MDPVGIKCLNQFENRSLPRVTSRFMYKKKEKLLSLEEIKAADNTSHSCLSALAISLGTLKLYHYNK